MATAIHQLNQHLGQLVRELQVLAMVKVDRAKIGLRNLMIGMVQAALGLVAATVFLVTCVIYLLSGVRGGIASATTPWAGDLIAGGLGLGLIVLAFVLGKRAMTRASRRALERKYGTAGTGAAGAAAAANEPVRPT